MISVPCLAEEEEEPEGPWSSLFVDSALGNVEALHEIWQKKFGSKASRFGSPSQAVPAEIQETPAPFRGAGHTEALPKVPHSSWPQTLASCVLPWDLPCQQQLGWGRVIN